MMIEVSTLEVSTLVYLHFTFIHTSCIIHLITPDFNIIQLVARICFKYPSRYHPIDLIPTFISIRSTESSLLPFMRQQKSSPKPSTKKRKEAAKSQAALAQEELDQILPLFESLSVRIEELEKTISDADRDWTDFLKEDQVVIVDRNKHQYRLEGKVTKVSPCYVWIKLDSPFQGRKTLQKSKPSVLHQHQFDNQDT